MNSCGCNNRENNCTTNIFFEDDTVVNRENTTSACREEDTTRNRENNVFPTNYKYGYTYVPLQTLNKVFEPEIALRQGTLFPELVDGYYPNQSVEMIEFLRTHREERS